MLINQLRRARAGVDIPSRIRLLIPPLIVAFAGVVLLGFLDRGLSFRNDDWYPIVSERGWSPDSLLTPYNDHWYTLTFLVFKLGFAVVGIHSAYPYLIILAIVHCASAFALYWLIRIKSGPALALGAMLLYIFVGQGQEGMFWPICVSLGGSALAGLCTLVLLRRADRPDHRVDLACGILLLGSIMFSSLGLIYMVAIGLELAAQRAWRRALFVLSLPGCAFVLWQLTFGRQVQQFAAESVGSLSQIQRLVLTVVLGPAQTLAALLELPLVAAVPVVAAAVIIIRRPDLRARCRRAEVVPPVATLGLLFVLLAVQQSNTGILQPRYIYAAAPFWLLVLTSILHSFRRRASMAALAVGVLVITAVNVGSLAQGAHVLRTEAQHRLHVLATVERVRSSPDFHGRLEFSPEVVQGITASGYLGAVDQLGSPVPQSLMSGPVDTSSDSEKALERVLQPAMEPASGLDPRFMSCPTTSRWPATATRTTIRPGQLIVVASPAASRLQIAFSYGTRSPLLAARTISLAAGSHLVIGAPRVDLAGPWTVELRPPAGWSGAICSGA